MIKIKNNKNIYTHPKPPGFPTAKCNERCALLVRASAIRGMSGKPVLNPGRPGQPWNLMKDQVRRCVPFFFAAAARRKCAKNPLNEAFKMELARGQDATF